MKKKATVSRRPKKSKVITAIVDFLDSTQLSRILIYSLLAVLVVFVLYVRVRLLTFPLERDEGEYALMGQMILKGIPPYELAYNMKLPGVYYLYALILALFGQTTTGIHIGLLLFNLTGVLLLFFVGKKLGSEALGLIASISYGILSLMPNHLGFAAHATQFMVPFVLGGFLCLLQYEKRPSYLYLILGGFLFGYAFIIKQHAIFLLLFGLASFIILEWKKKPVRYLSLILRLAVLGFSMTLPYILVVLTSVLTGTLHQFWHWTSEYAREYISITTMSEIMTNFKLSFFSVINGLNTIWILGAIGLIAVFFTKAVRPYRWIIFLYAISSAATVIPGFYFRPHYYILFLPALGLLAGVTIVLAGELLRKVTGPWLLPVPILLFGVAVGYAIWLYDPYFFQKTPLELCTRVYREENPFAISMDIADYIKKNTTEEDKIAVIGSEPQIYFYSNRLPATGFIYTYALAESQPFSEDMQREMIAEIEMVKPKYIVLINSVQSWGKPLYVVKNVMDWYVEFVKQYETVEVIDINPGEEAKFYSGEALLSYQQKSKSSIWISKLKAE